MAFEALSQKTGKKYYLNSKEVTLANNYKRRIYYFSSVISEFSIDELPEGFEIVESKETGLPLLRRIGKEVAAKKTKKKKISKK